MAADPAVSFLVLCYNLGDYVGECIASILAQHTDISFEVIVVDDASTHHSPEVIAGFRDPRLRVVRHAANQGHARTVNEAISLARGAFIARIDADDRYRPEFLTKTIEVFQQCPEVDLVYGDVVLIDDKGQVAVDSTEKRCSYKSVAFIPLLEKNFICAPSVIARREAWRRVPPV